jgi:hypothetical protein
MSNERIDLTQFEGMTEGPWHCCLPYNAETDTYEGDAQMKGGGDRVNGPVVLSQYQFARGTANQRADLRAMESCPELIAELKKMYEREDALVSAIKKLCDSEDSTGCSGDLTVVSLDPMLRLYELTSYSAYR